MSVELSIIIPAYNEAAMIAKGLSSIETHLRGIEHEVIVVDNGSQDDTATVAGRFAGVRVMSIAKSSIGRARNQGAAIARGRLFAFLDADVLITAEWAQAVAQKLALVRSGADYFGGYPFDIPEHASLIERAWFGASNLGRLSYIGSANLLVSAHAYQGISGFDEKLQSAEDVDFGRRIRRAGHTMDVDPRLHVIHLGFPRSFRHFIKRERWHGMGSFRDLPTFLQSKVSVAAVIFTLLLLTALLLLAAGNARAGLLLLGLHLLTPILYVVYRFQFRNWRHLPMQYLLGYAYLAARTASGISALARLTAVGHRSS